MEKEHLEVNQGRESRTRRKKGLELYNDLEAPQARPKSADLGSETNAIKVLNLAKP